MNERRDAGDRAKNNLDGGEALVEAIRNLGIEHGHHGAGLGVVAGLGGAHPPAGGERPRPRLHADLARDPRGQYRHRLQPS